MLTRRDGLRAGLAGFGLAISPAAIWAEARAAAPQSDPLLDRVCDLVIPKTDTEGALGARVPDYVRLSLAHADGETLDGTEWKTVSRALAAQGFGKGKQDAAILGAVDAAAFKDKPDETAKAWRRIKSLIVTGYYTSEIGGARELRYNLVPGRFDPDLPVRDDTPELSNDWIAVNFR